ncbi:U3 small nucleolar ribonucleoprotein protein MPP10 [Anopheles ziemanni]|uniref:U3 small nucleolar ribonucleoprotein protein MPP10 n=1 Tax=Anopheles coustani TaxID=139045 RepID=UPI002657EEEB|nr:U3 small nucleolar ribonucleoprotein protein MPP10 [Anopheles coustani]XP_058169464.1 U3 small nucleolar ribonucleoprotein protein MPP10 [Anopheles ziemanni]
MVKSIVLTPKASKKELSLEACLNRFRKHTKRPEVFLKLQTQLSNDLKSLLKTVYDHGTKTGFNKSNDAPYLDELVTEQMDEEQIWQQLELKNEYFVDQDLKKTSEILSKKEKALQLNFSTETKSDYGSDEDRSADEEEDSAGENGIEQESGKKKMNGVSSKKTKKVEKSKKSKKGKKEKKSKAKGSIVDDRFFRLDDMAKFLDEEDERERRRQHGLGEKNPLIEIDYFDEHAAEDDDDEDAAAMKYSDFFDDDDDEEDDEDDEDGENEEEEDDYGSEGIEDEEDDEASEAGMNQEDDEEESDMEQDEDTTENVAEEEELSDEAAVERNRKLRYDIYKSQGGIPLEEKEKPKKVTFEQPESSDSEDDKADKSNGPKSSFELRQEKLDEKISKMEQKLLKEKPWQLKGEISAETRPQNSLLEEILQFENTSRPVPIISEETTMKLEDIIKQRIKNKAFDDVERKVRPPDNPREYRKQLVLDGEKSKESLAQVYEQDYLKQLEQANPDAADQPEEEPKEHKEIRRMMKTLLAQLDALSNFHYTPRPAVPELKILTNTPAISMEEVAPVAASDATLLAPEEVHRRPKGDVMSKEERTKTKQNRERRLKKRFQKEKFRREAEQEQKQLAKADSSSSKQNRTLQTSLLKKVTQAKNVQQMTETTGPAKTSTAFFSQLQDEVRTHVKEKAQGNDKKKKQKADNLQAASLKL